jgi:hypothetical protein
VELTRTYQTTAADPLALAKALGVGIDDIGLRIGLTGRRVRQMARDTRHAARVRRAVLELALDRARWEAMVR